MAHLDIASPSRPSRGVFTKTLSAIGAALVRMAEAGPQMDAVRRLNALTDAELAARGTTRAEMVGRIFADRI